VWNSDVYVDQDIPVVQITSRSVQTGHSTRVTVCLRAETRLAARSNAAFFDSAALLVSSP
jgi:hypothetical protein